MFFSAQELNEVKKHCTIIPRVILQIGVPRYTGFGLRCDDLVFKVSLCLFVTEKRLIHTSCMKECVPSSWWLTIIFVTVECHIQVQVLSYLLRICRIPGRRSSSFQVGHRLLPTPGWLSRLPAYFATHSGSYPTLFLRFNLGLKFTELEVTTIRTRLFDSEAT